MKSGKFASRTGFTSRFIGLILALLIVCWSTDVHAQSSVLGTYAFEARWLDGVGTLSHHYNAGGAEPEPAMRGEGMTWPAHVPYADNHRGNGLTIATRNWTDDSGEEWGYKVSHIGMRPSGLDEMFPQSIRQVSRFEPPDVSVDGLQTFRQATFNDEVDPEMKADRMIEIVVNNFFGIKVEKTIKQFGQAFHDDYHIIEWTLTNTGNIDDDPEIELPGQTLTDVYMSRQYLPYISGQASYYPGMAGMGWGQYNMRDVVGDGMENYETDLRATYEWAGKKPDFTEFNNIGGPAITDQSWTTAEGDSSGRLLAAYMVGSATVHADGEANDEPKGTDDRDQPSTTTYVDIESPLAGASGFNREQMQREYEDWIAAGHTYPHHADAVARPDGEDYSWDRQRMANQTAAPDFGGGGRMILNSYGPYTLEPGESVHIVEARGLAGLSKDANREIGSAYKQAWLEGDEERDIEYEVGGRVHAMPKNEWVMTSRDSLFQLFERAIANYESGYNIPQPPKPPSRFSVTSLPDQIELTWDIYDENPPRGFELYRARHRVESIPEDDFEYKLIAGTDELGPNARSYTDTDVNRGIGYYYFLQAVGETNVDATGGTPTGVVLKSNRYYTQTYDPATLKREPGSTLKDVTVVPNPYNLGSDRDVRWPDRDNQIGFLDVPGECTIRIYTELGELIETIEHTDGSGDVFWDLTTSSEQLIVSGLYVAVISDHETGDTTTRKLIVIR